MKARPYQAEAIDAIFRYFATHPDPSHNCVIACPTGCHAAGHGILMYDGTVRHVEDVRVGDLVMGPDSLPRNVLALARGRQEMRRITPNKGESFVVNLDHKLSVKVVAHRKVVTRKSELGRIETITVRAHENGTNWYRHIRKLRRVGVDFPKAEQLLDPRFVGMMLGDGSLASGSVMFSGTEPEMFGYVERIAHLHGCKFVTSSNRTFYIVGTKGLENPVMRKFRQLGLCGTRSNSVFIPQQYLIADKHQRMELLAGIIDAEGYIDHCNCFEVVTTSKQFSKDLLFLSRSLGFAAYATEGVAILDGKSYGPKWRVLISGDGLEEIETLIPYKKARVRAQVKDVLCTGFTTDVLPEDNYYGFTLDGDNLYLDESFTVHHNTGKAFILTEFMRRVITWWPGQRLMNLVHVKELVDQNAKTLRRIWPQAPIGVYSAGLGQKVAHMPITFAGVKSVAQALDKFGRQDILVIDECHLVSDKEESDYQKVIAYFRALDPNLRIVGLSATPYRLGLGMITDGTLFSHVAYDITGLDAFNRLIDEGYLARLIPIQTALQLDVKDVGKVAGEFNAGQLQTAVNRKELTRAALRETMRHAQDRAHWLIFATGVEHVQDIYDMITTEFGISATMVHGKLSKGERDENLRKFKAGEVRACINANVLTTGFDMPHLDCIICLRPTNSVVLHIQILGRGTRPFYMDGFDLDTVEGRLAAIDNSPKRNCLILDFAGNVMRLGPVNDPRIPKRGNKGVGDMPVKLCDPCGCLNHISARFCDNCGEQFEIQEKITEKASTAVVIANAVQPETADFAVTHVVYNKHTKPGSPDMLKVSYYCGVQRFSEYVLLEHFHSNIRHKAAKWWKDRSNVPVPNSIDEALAQEATLRKPNQVRVWINKTIAGKLKPEILTCIF